MSNIPESEINRSVEIVGPGAATATPLHGDITIDDIREAQTRINPYMNHTPTVRTSRSIMHSSGYDYLGIKAEHFQKTGSVMARGAMNAVLALKEREQDGLSDSNVTLFTTTSTNGNFGRALAFACAIAGGKCHAHVVLPKEYTRDSSRAAMKSFSAKVLDTQLESTHDNDTVQNPAAVYFSRAAVRKRQVEQHTHTFPVTSSAPSSSLTGPRSAKKTIYDQLSAEAQMSISEQKGETQKSARFICPSHNVDVVTGYATLGLELAQLADEQAIDAVLVPVGSGALLAGVAMGIKLGQARGKNIKVYGVEPESFPKVTLHWQHRYGTKTKARLPTIDVDKINKDPSARLFPSGLVQSGLPGELTLALMEQYVDGMIVVGAHEIADALQQTMQRMKFVIQASSVLTMAAALFHRKEILVPSSSASVRNGAEDPIEAASDRATEEKTNNNTSSVKGLEPAKNVVAVLSGGNVDFSRFKFYASML